MGADARFGRFTGHIIVGGAVFLKGAHMLQQYRRVRGEIPVHHPQDGSEIQRALPQATPRMLSKQLKELEKDGIVLRVLYPVVPPKTEYSLTEFGQTLVPIVRALCAWGEHYFELAGLPVPGN